MVRTGNADRWSRRELLEMGCEVVMAAGAGPVFAAAGTGAEEHSRRETERKEAIRTGLVCEDKYLDHTLAEHHPESPERLRAILRRLKATGLDQQLKTIRASGDALPYIRMIHPKNHLELVAKQAQDESICRLAAAGVLRAVDAVFKGEVRNAFCAVRPPGHHATNTGEFGFCFYNNVAIAARYAQKEHKIERVLIVDWDYHHGNGTEWAFYEDPTVLFFSTHRLEAFPQTGFAERRGKGKGLGYNINVPLPRGADDQAILGAFKEQMVPAAEKFRPELVLVSAGFDSRKDDLLGDFAVTDEGFAKLTRLMMDVANRYAGSRLVSVLEGGYNPEGLAHAVESHIRTLINALSAS
jgi:acetoin utilization deacetylase AcuC-like enzyme